MDENTKLNLEIISTKISLSILDCVYNAKSGHPGGSLSIADLLSYLYFYRMHVDPLNPHMPERDRLVLSKGHCSPALYSALALKGYFDKEELIYFRKLGYMLQGHPDLKKIPGVDMSSGSLGQGISAACGMAFAEKQSKYHYNVYAILGDGEIQEGQVWEAAMFASAKKLSNLCIFIDFNNLQITGPTTDIMNPTPIDEKFKSFGWNSFIIDGHNFEEIDEALKRFDASTIPTAVICNTIKGKGVSFMENNYYWHGNAPKQQEYELARSEVEQKLKSLLEDQK